MTVYVASARIDENGNAYGGKAGDQNGKEVSSQVWYDYEKNNPGKTWVLLRCIDPEKRKKIAKCMRDAYVNAFIGYDQHQRDSLYDAVKDLGFNVNTLEKAVETDCSALVRICVCYAGINCQDFNTASQSNVLVKTGFFKKITDTKYTKSPDYLLEGDILVSSKQGHTVVVLNDGAKAATDTEWDWDAVIIPNAPNTVPANDENTVTVAEGTYFLRRGPGKEYPHDGVYVVEDTVLEKVDTGTWTAVKYKNKDGTLEVRYLGASGVRKE